MILGLAKLIYSYWLETQHSMILAGFQQVTGCYIIEGPQCIFEEWLRKDSFSQSGTCCLYKWGCLAM
jgi:hypothetical protein